MKTNKVLLNFKDISRYIIYLSFEEQIHEINNIIKYLVKYKYPRINFYHKFWLINDMEKFKEYLIRLHLQELKNNPSLAVSSKPLYKLLSVK